MNKGGFWSKIASACGTEADCDFCDVKLENVPQNGYTDAINAYKLSPFRLIERHSIKIRLRF